MAALAGRTVVLFGRFQIVPRYRFADAIKRRDKQLMRDVTNRTRTMIVGRGAIIYAENGVLDEKIGACAEFNVTVMSEREGAEALGLAEPRGVGVPVDVITARSRLTPDDIEFLRLFDVVSIRNGKAEFRDVEKAEAVSRLLSDGQSIIDVVKTFHRLDDGARVAVVTAPNGDIALQWGGSHTTLSGQGLLPLDAGPPLEEIFEAALEAETLGDLDTAERLYELCVRSDKKDALAAFNLGNVLIGLGRAKDAEVYFRHAIVRDPAMAEAHYNLGVATEARGDAESARSHFQSAIGVSTDYTDAIYSLALLEFSRNRFDEAAPLFRKFLRIEPDGEWAVRAKKALTVCDSIAKSA